MKRGMFESCWPTHVFTELPLGRYPLFNRSVAETTTLERLCRNFAGGKQPARLTTEKNNPVEHKTAQAHPVPAFGGPTDHAEVDNMNASDVPTSCSPYSNRLQVGTTHHELGLRHTKVHRMMVFNRLLARSVSARQE